MVQNVRALVALAGESGFVPMCGIYNISCNSNLGDLTPSFDLSEKHTHGIHT